MSKKRVGIKYCGGCNPGYERVEMVERVRSSVKDRFLFLPHDQQGLDALESKLSFVLQRYWGLKLIA